jgi:hypothetical protein
MPAIRARPDHFAAMELGVPAAPTDDAVWFTLLALIFLAVTRPGDAYQPTPKPRL